MGYGYFRFFSNSFTSKEKIIINGVYMGIDVHGLQFLRYVYDNFGALGDVATLGRQSINVGPKAAVAWGGDKNGLWCEDLLTQHFRAKKIDSIDNSPYEGATVIVDFNKKIPEHLKGKYDTVLDYGFTEHVFNVAQSFENIRSLCKKNGRIMHVVPSAGFCGHGLYQFSPELFFSLYSEFNGFDNTQIFMADLCEPSVWYRVKKPRNGERVNIVSESEVYILVVTELAGGKEVSVQQSDYEFLWSKIESIEHSPRPPKAGRFAGLREALSCSVFLNRLLKKINNYFLEDGPRKLSKHPLLERINLPSLY